MNNRIYLLPLMTGLMVGMLALPAAADKPKAEPVRVATTKGIIDIKNHQRPKDATQLVGKEKHILVSDRKDGKSNWTFADGVLTAPKGWDSLLTPKAYGDFLLHVEFNCNAKPRPEGDEKFNLEADGNSGVYIQQRYEIQIQNAHGIPEDEFKHSYNGSIYKMKKPDKLVSKPAGEWQTYVIAFRAARFKDGKKTENARITVYHNGVLIHDDFAMPRKTGAGKKEGPEKMPLKLQGHANPVKFRNVWVKELDLD